MKKACHCIKGTPIGQGQFSGFPVPALAPDSAPVETPASHGSALGTPGCELCEWGPVGSRQCDSPTHRVSVDYTD